MTEQLQLKLGEGDVLDIAFLLAQLLGGDLAVDGLAELILRGVLQPSDLHVLRSSEVQMAVNQQTARALGVTIPADLSFDQHD